VIMRPAGSLIPAEYLSKQALSRVNFLAKIFQKGIDFFFRLYIIIIGKGRGNKIKEKLRR